MEDSVVADDPQPTAGMPQEPFFEPIGPDADKRGGESANEGLDTGRSGSLRPGFARTSLVKGLADWLVSLTTIRFWFTVAAAVLCTWAAAGSVVLLAPLGGGAGPEVFPLLVYSLASALMPATATLPAVAWGVRAEVRFRGMRGRTGGFALLAVLLATALRGLVLAAVVLGVLLVQAWIAGASGAVAAVSAGVVLVECGVFGAMGAGLSAWAGRPRLANAAGGLLALAFVAGAPAAAIGLLPLVRAEERVTVALNVERARDGTHVAFRCSEIEAGISEVYHTERLMWLPALSPPVLFLMAGAEADRAGQVLGWVPAAIQEAADGMQVPCVQGQPRSRDEPRAPMPGMGLLGQAAIAGAIVAGGYRAARRRDGAPGDPV